MRNYILILIIVFGIFSCRRKDTYPDYKTLVGKFKLVYIQKWNQTWPLDSFENIVPSDKYEIEFKKWSKVMLIKNGDCQKTMKVYSCKWSIPNGQYPSDHYYMNIDRKDYDFEFPYYPSVGSTKDTLVAVFYPFNLVDVSNGNFYSCRYLKE